MSGDLNVAVAQFNNSSDIQQNLTQIIRYIEEASHKQCDIIQFSENSLSGYFGIDKDFIFEKDEIENAIEQIKATCKSNKISTIIGSHRFDDVHQKPFISLFVIDHWGNIITIYDKRFLYGQRETNDHKYYQSGENIKQFNIKDITCGLLICHEWRYPELYREQKKNGSKIVFHSWFDGGLSETDFQNSGKHNGELIVGSVKGYAANNHMWICGSNTSCKKSAFGSFIVQPDGRILKQLDSGSPSLLIESISLDQTFEDPSGDWRDLAMNGILTNKN